MARVELLILAGKRFAIFNIRFVISILILNISVRVFSIKLYFSLYCVIVDCDLQ